jgi:hypothetical protein
VRREALFSNGVAWVGALLLSASACAVSDTTIESTPHPEINSEVAEVSALVESMSELSSAESEDLAMAWNDLNSDLMSIIRDAAHDPGSVDLGGMLVRIDSFQDRFGSHEPMERLGVEWEQLMETLTTVAHRVDSEVDSGTVVEAPFEQDAGSPRTG